MDGPAFESFSLQHMLATSLTLTLVVLLVALARRIPERYRRPCGRIVAGALVSVRAAESVWRLNAGERWFEVVPLHLCGLSLLLTAWMLWSGSDRAFQVVYFWVVVGATLSLITPDLAFGFPHIAFFSFYFAHSVPIFGIGYGLFVYGLRPRARSIITALVAIWAVAAVAAVWNLTFDTNFMFLRRKPQGVTLFDWFGPWPWYLVTVNFVGLALFALAYLPFVGKQGNTATT